MRSDLEYLISRTWYSHTQDMTVHPSIALDHLKLASLSIHLDEIEATISVASNKKTICFVYDGWKLEKLTAYRPLVYLCAFGSEDLFRCTALACKSLCEFGDYEGDILIITDRSKTDMAKLLPFLSGRLKVWNIHAVDTLDYTHARFRVESWPDISLYSPILYIDTDIVSNSPVLRILHNILKQDKVCCVSEAPLDVNDHWYGAPFFRADKSANAVDNLGLSSGVFGAPSIDHIANHCRSIVACSYAYAEANNNRRMLDLMDQPFFNYALRKLGGFDLSLTPFVGSVFGLGYNFDFTKNERKGLIHFCGGVGNATPKIDAMHRYVAGLRNAEVPSSRAAEGARADDGPQAGSEAVRG